ncbi:GNAT family N-acetyltransferase [Qipengyuania gaetbuli]|uniref:GNAT family N-acetyltransferase n=1 Tax=Qipengyuania gaetbuli TaxID=266952 RepID=UPI001CD43C42|nr:GNAT family N-acetyltransferase [Qipengyuania gaetbuli]MCA0911287.1 GNAT family N-acetyltransferase [Qipengyuania gaetbuli]
MVITVSYHDTASKLQGVRHDRSGPFDGHEWFELLEQHGWEPVIALAEDALALPLTRVPKGLESLTNWFSFTWAPVGEAGEGAAGQLRALAADLKRRTARVDLSPLAGEDRWLGLLEEAFRTSGWLVFREKCDDNHILQVNGRNFEQYWASRPGQMRSTVQRKLKKVKTKISTQFYALEWQTYQSIYKESWKPTEERADLLEAFARSESERGHYRLGIAFADDEPVAAQFWTIENGTAYIHKLAHLKEAENLSAGTVLTAAMFECAIDTDGATLVDFGTGSDPYKRDWMEECRPRYRLTCLDPRQVAAWPGIAKRLLGRLARG